MAETMQTLEQWLTEQKKNENYDCNSCPCMNHHQALAIIEAWRELFQSSGGKGPIPKIAMEAAERILNEREGP